MRAPSYIISNSFRGSWGLPRSLLPLLGTRLLCIALQDEICLIQSWDSLELRPFGAFEISRSSLMRAMEGAVRFACLILHCAGVEFLLAMRWWLRLANSIYSSWVSYPGSKADELLPEEGF